MGTSESIPWRFIFLRLRTEDIQTEGKQCEDIQRLEWCIYKPGESVLAASEVG